MVSTLFKLTLLSLVHAAIVSAEVNAQVEVSSSALAAEQQALQAEQDSLELQWQENQDLLNQMGAQYEALNVPIASARDRLEGLRIEAETLLLIYERKLPEFNIRESALERAKEQLESEVDSYYSDCDVTVTEEEYPRKYAECQDQHARLESALENNFQDTDQLDEEVHTLRGELDLAVEIHDELLSEIESMETQQESFLDEGLIIQAASEEIVLAGLELDIQIQELDRSILQQNNVTVDASEYQAATGQAFTEAQELANELCCLQTS